MEIADPNTGYCPNGFYPNPKDCTKFIVCWNDGVWGDMIDCAPGTVFNDRLSECDHPWNLPEDHECYQPES